MSHILSFDIGTRNLAVCEIDREQRVIYEWSVIDLLHTENTPHCEFHNPCARQPVHYYAVETEKKWFCSQHKKKFLKIRRPSRAVENPRDLRFLSRQIVYHLDLLCTETRMSQTSLVLLEKQPFKRMSTVHDFMYMYFRIRFPSVEILSVSATKKLGSNNSRVGKPLSTERRLDNKGRAKQMCKTLLDANFDNETMERFCQAKQNHDMADAFLQTVSFWS